MKKLLKKGLALSTLGIVATSSVVSPMNVKAASTDIAGYVTEYAIPWTGATQLYQGQAIGIDLQVNDCSNGKRNGTLNMFDKTGKAWNDTSLLGTAILVGDANAPIYSPNDRYKKAIAAVETKTPINADGYVDATWAKAKEYDLTYSGTNQTSTAKVKLMWDKNYLYVLYMVYDGNLDKSSKNNYENDSTEIFVDENYARSGSYSWDDLHYRVDFMNTASEDKKSSNPNWKHGTTRFTKADAGIKDDNNSGNQNQGGQDQGNQNQSGQSGSIIRPEKANISQYVSQADRSFQNGVTYGTASKKYYYSNITNSYRPYNILLPKGYTTSKKYPVIYMLHGIGGNEDAFGTNVNNSALMRIAGNLMAKGECKDAIIVFPNIRVSTTPETNIFNAENYKNYDRFREELINNLMPHINSTYSVKTGRENTAVAGFSMGGRETLYIGVSKSDKFGYVGAFCPAYGIFTNNNFGVYADGLFTEKTFTLPKNTKNNTFLMIVKGSSDNVVNDQPYKYSQVLKQNGNNHIYYETAGGHDETVYSHGFYNFLKNVFR